MIAEAKGFGYASCIKSIPNNEASQMSALALQDCNIFLITVNWLKFSDDDRLFTVQFVNENKAIAAGKNKKIRTKFEI